MLKNALCQVKCLWIRDAARWILIRFGHSQLAVSSCVQSFCKALLEFYINCTDMRELSSQEGGTKHICKMPKYSFNINVL